MSVHPNFEDTLEPVSEEVKEDSRENATTAHEALFPDASEEDSDDQDSFT